MAQFIKSDGTTKEVQPKNGNDFSIQELQTFVGGYIEIISFGHKLMVVNEEGKLLGLPLNDVATHLLVTNHQPQFIVGDVLVCNDNQIR